MIRAGQAVKNIWMLSREYGSIAGAGGVKDVAEQLSLALAAWSGRRVSVVLPLYGFIDPSALGFSTLQNPFDRERELQFEVDMDYVGKERREEVRVWYGKHAKVNLYLIDSKRFREKGDVYTYTLAEEQLDSDVQHGKGHFDYFAMNLLLQKATLQLILLLGERPDVIHCHDGHTAVLPAIIEETPWLKSYFGATGYLLTIHNAGVGYHQEVADLPYAHAMTSLPWRVVLQSRLQGKFDPLVCAALYAQVNTVSENYARELQQSESDEQTGWLGHHLADLGITIEGITNGIDPAGLSPVYGKEIGLEASFDPIDRDSMGGKEQCRAAFLSLLAAGGCPTGIVQHGLLERGEQTPLFTFIGRLSEQKGIDILLGGVRQLLQRDADFQLAILGKGEGKIEKQLADLATSPESDGRICFLDGFDTDFSYRVFAAGDFFLVPSSYEPCGLTDFIAQLFGNIPIVHEVGGLVKVIDGRTGLSYGEHSPEALVESMERAMLLYPDKEKLYEMQRKSVEVIQQKYLWKKVKDEYVALYKKAMLRKLS